MQSASAPGPETTCGPAALAVIEIPHNRDRATIIVSVRPLRNVVFIRFLFTLGEERYLGVEYYVRRNGIGAAVSKSTGRTNEEAFSRFDHIDAGGYTIGLDLASHANEHRCENFVVSIISYDLMR